MCFIIKTLLLVCAGVAVSAYDCCLPGETLHKSNRSDRLYCQEENGGNNKSDIILTCPETALIAHNDDLKFIVNDNDQLVLLLPNRQVNYEPEKYCAGHAKIRNKNKFSIGRVALICKEETERVIDESVNGYCMLISVICLIVTACLYTTRGEMRDLQGKSVVNLCISLALGLAILVAMKLLQYSDMNLCAARGFFAYYFMLVSFFWMNAISIQVLWGLRFPPGQEKPKRSGFAWYAAYAWGVPAVLTIGMAIVNFMPGDHLKPGIGLNHCWFFNVAEQWHYMYSVVSILIVVNIIIFVTATVFICCHGFPSHESFKNKFTKCLQLLVVMGIPWLFEMISSLTPHHLVWEITDLFNALQGVWIFLVLAVIPRRENKEDHDQYKINITSVEQPYEKMDKY